ncbi:MAG: aspartate kinase, partial [Burkholderiales bacterium]
MHKFGGAALADAAAILNVAELLGADVTGQRRVVVTSALQGVTNQLVAAIGHADDGDAHATRAIVAQIRERHLEVARGVQGDHPSTETLDALRTRIAGACDELDDQLNALTRKLLPAAPLADAILAHGERLAARILCVALETRGMKSVVVDATQLVYTDGRHGNAAPDLARTDAAAPAIIDASFAQHDVVIVPGFIGAGQDGAVVTLGRGGSDLTAAVLARAIDAREVILWKDVAGVMTADPRIVPEARVVGMLDAREASELAYYGAKVLHPRTLLPLRAGMTLRLRPFGDPAAAGTTIVVGRVARGAPVRAISGMSQQALVAVSGTGMLGVPGVAARVFGALATAHISVSMISQASSEQSICFTVPADRAEEVAD